MTEKNVGMRRQAPLRQLNAAKNHPRPACGRQSSQKQEPSVPVLRSSGGFRFIERKPPRPRGERIDRPSFGIKPLEISVVPKASAFR